MAKKTAMVQYGILAFMAAQGGLMARLTYWEYSWDIMEPITFFLTYGSVFFQLYRKVYTGKFEACNKGRGSAEIFEFIK